MKRFIPYAIMALAFAASVTSCNSDDAIDSSDNYIMVTFENTGATLAGPTSYGANLYDTYSGTQYTGAEIQLTDKVKLQFGLNVSQWSGNKDFYGGGLVLSNWNYRSNPAGETAADWWYTYQNQCSVYNTLSADGTNQGAGADGSNTFAVAFGYDSPENGDTSAKFNFSNGAEFQLYSVMLCNTSYAYGLMINGNPFGNTPDKNLIEAGGWFKVEFYGFDAQGRPTNSGVPVEMYLADGRRAGATLSDVIARWTVCDLTPLGKVNSVKISFSGSDTGQYGLNTPTYVALDNLVINIGE